MVKIERLKNNAIATFTRNGSSMPVFVNQLMTLDEFQTLKVTSGTVVASIDENEIVEVSATSTNPSSTAPSNQASQPAPAAEPVVESTTQEAAEFVNPEPEQATIEVDPRFTKPNIVTPAPRTK